MIVKRRPVITWLLDPETKNIPKDLLIPNVSNPINDLILTDDLKELDQIRVKRPNWGVPELVLPSFENAMKKNAPAFDKLQFDLFKEFSENEECGILLYKGSLTLVYGFGDDAIHLWFFSEHNGKSVFNFYASCNFEKYQKRIGIANTIIADDKLFKGTMEERQTMIGSVFNFIFAYVAVKKYGKVDIVVVPVGKFTAIDDTPLEYDEKRKIINKTGQEVIIMDSKWFRKIVNDNDIPVRGYWKMQPKKNDEGEWYKELIFVDQYVRKGYHRDAKIENSDVVKYFNEDKSEDSNE